MSSIFQLPKIKLKVFRQKEKWSCGPTALKILLHYLGIRKTEKELFKLSQTTPRLGTHHLQIIKVLKDLGFKVKYGEWGDFRLLNYLVNERNLPVIVDWFLEDEGHYSVVCGLNKRFIWLADPAIGKIRKMPWEKFLKVWFDFEEEYLTKKKNLVVRWWLTAFK